MIFSGFQIRNFRSIGEEPLIISPLRKCNILVGQNNVGKSNVLKALKLISDNFTTKGVSLNQLDLHNRSKDQPFNFRLIFRTSNDSEMDKLVEAATENNTVWFEFSWVETGKPYMVDHSLTELKNLSYASKIFNLFSGYVFNSQPSIKELKNNFLKDEHKRRFFEKFQNLIPRVEIIPEFRKMQSGGMFAYDGQNLVQTLSQYRSPDIGKDHHQVKF